MTGAAVIKLSAKAVIAPIDDRLFGSFIEHMGRAVYTGIYEPTHASAGADGFRQDVIRLIQQLHVPCIRYPGGNFVSGYRWEDGVGPLADRPVRPDLAWFALEPNQVGTNEFMEFLRQVGATPMLAVNLGTRGAQDAANLLEYCNFSGGTYYSDLRIAHGFPEPHNIKLWCLGNEMDGPWQICGKTAEEYGRLACETAKLMKWLDPDIELVACGSSFQQMPTFGEWERTVLRHTYDHIDYLSLHSYYTNMEGDIRSFLASNVSMDAFIKDVATICRQIKAEKKSSRDVYLSFDEWNVWYHFRKDGQEPARWIQARPIEEEHFDFADALVVGSLLTTLINNSDVVKIACLAQLVNVIAPIMTEPGGAAWVQTIYYPFMYTSLYGRGTALKVDLASPSYACAVDGAVPCIDCAAVVSAQGDELRLFIVNKDLEQDLPCQINLAGFTPSKVIEWVTMAGYELAACNTAEDARVQPSQREDAVITGQDVIFTLPRASWNMLRLKTVPGTVLA